MSRLGGVLLAPLNTLVEERYTVYFTRTAPRNWWTENRFGAMPLLALISLGYGVVIVIIVYGVIIMGVGYYIYILIRSQSSSLPPKWAMPPAPSLPTPALEPQHLSQPPAW